MFYAKKRGGLHTFFAAIHRNQIKLHHFADRTICHFGTFWRLRHTYVNAFFVASCRFSEIRISTNVVITKCIPRRVIHMQRLMSKHAMSELDQTSLERSASVFLSMLISAANYRSVEDLFCSSAQKAYACDDFRCVFLIFRRVLYLENYMKKLVIAATKRFSAAAPKKVF